MLVARAGMKRWGEGGQLKAGTTAAAGGRAVGGAAATAPGAEEVPSDEAVGLHEGEQRCLQGLWSLGLVGAAAAAAAWGCCKGPCRQRCGPNCERPPSPPLKPSAGWTRDLPRMQWMCQWAAGACGWRRGCFARSLWLHPPGPASTTQRTNKSAAPRHKGKDPIG